MYDRFLGKRREKIMRQQFIRIELMPVGPLGMAAAEAGGQILGMGVQQLFGNANADKQMRNSKSLMDYQQRLQYEMWLKTNYSAQVEQMKAAGINPALLYGMSGGGGQTTGNASATAPMQSLPSMGMGLGQVALQAQLQKAQIENIKADTAKKNVEATKTAGVDTQLGQTEIQRMEQEIDNKRYEYEILKVDLALRRLQEYETAQSQENRLQQIATATEAALKNLQILANETKISDETLQSTIYRIKQEAIGAAIQNTLMRANIEKTKAGTAVDKQYLQNLIQQMNLDNYQNARQEAELMLRRIQTDFDTDIGSQMLKDLGGTITGIIAGLLSRGGNVLTPRAPVGFKPNQKR